MGLGINLAEKGIVPDTLIQMGIRKLLKQRLTDVYTSTNNDLDGYSQKIIGELKSSSIAIETDLANKQHYEIPAEFFHLTLGKHLKYSSAYYGNGAKSLDQAEHDMLELTAQRAQIKDGMKVMDLGCGWGSFSLWAAAKFPNCQITSVSNSSSQKSYIDSTAAERGLKNIQVITANINDFNTDQSFDRIVSIEMFEHMRNYQLLMAKISRWLSKEGKLFVHIFCHKEAPYYFETKGDDDWMANYFFTGGIMPSNSLLSKFNDDLKLVEQWKVNGRHYEKTCLDWLENADKNKQAILDVFKKTYGQKDAFKWLQRWRIFFLACAELFGYNNGEEWWVAHHLFENK